MEETTTLGIDLAKRVFALHGVNALGRVVCRRLCQRDELVRVVAQLSPCLIGMEACSGAHEWARQFARLGHTVRLMAPKFVRPYRKTGKNDFNDAEAICEAVGRPNMRFVPVKSAEQQAILTLHRVRQGFVEERTATINRIRGLLSEFGFVLPQKAIAVRRGLPPLLDRLPGLARQSLADLYVHLALLDERIQDYERQIVQLARQNEAASRLTAITGIGPIIALALVATVGNARSFDSGRQFAAWLGLVPKQWSSGGKIRLGRITRRGDAYLRRLLTLGARSAIEVAHRRTDRMSRWIVQLQARIGYHKTIIAVAAKNARIAWALLTKGETLGRRRRCEA
jgi:transposase